MEPSIFTGKTKKISGKNTTPPKAVKPKKVKAKVK